MAIPLELNGLEKTYPGGQQALRGLDLSVKRGEVFGFLGPNGAGKTTTIKILLGFCQPTAGTARVCGGDPANPDTRRSLGYLPEVADYYGFLSAPELLAFYGRLCGMTRVDLGERIPATLEKVGLADVGKKRIGTFSKGMKQRVGLAQALLHDPAILILDEPLSGLDPLGRRQVRNIICELRNEGKTVFFSSHELSEAEMIADRVAILKNGRVRQQGPIAEIAGDGEANLERIFLEAIESEGENDGDTV